MTQVFAAINHRLSEEYAKIELPSLEAKHRYASHRANVYPLPFTDAPLGSSQMRAISKRS